MNGCHNKPERKQAYLVQDGWTDYVKPRTRSPIMRLQPDVLSKGCGHDARLTDPGCVGCRWAECGA